MADTSVLSIDYWHSTVVAAVRTEDGRMVPIAVDGATALSTDVAIDEHGTLHAGRDATAIGAQDPGSLVRLPGQRLLEDQVTVGSRFLDPAALVSTTLTRVADEATALLGTRPARVVISVPAGWTARQREHMKAAAQWAGLGQPQVINGSEAIVREEIAHGAAVPAGSVVAVCRLDATVGDLVLLRHEADQLEPIATFDLGELGETPGATLIDQTSAALTQALDAAGVQASDVGAAFWQLPSGQMAELSDALSNAPGLRVTPIHVGELAAAFGGARWTVSKAVPVRRRRQRLATVRSGVTAIVAWLGALTLTYQVLRSSTLYPATSVSEPKLVTEWYAWGLIPVLAVIGAASAWITLAGLGARRRQPAPPGRDTALGSALATIAALGVGVAIALALVGAHRLDTTPGPLLRWTLWSTVPLAAALAVLGTVVALTNIAARTPHSRQPMAWRDRLRFPWAAVVLATVSTVSIAAAHVNVPSVDPDLWWRMEHIGAFGLGWAGAFLIATDPWRRINVGFLLSVPAANAINPDTTGVFVALFMAVVTLWWLLPIGAVALPKLARLIIEADRASKLAPPSQP